MDDADGVRRRHRPRGLYEQVQPRLQRDLPEAALFLRPLHQVPFWVVAALHEVRTAVALRLVKRRDVRPVAQSGPQHHEELFLPLEGAQALGVEAELEDPLLSGAAVPRQPDFAEAALTELLLDEPSRASGDFPSHRGPPAERLRLVGIDVALHLVGVGRRLRGCQALRSDFEDVDRFIQALEDVMPAGQPRQLRSRSAIVRRRVFPDIQARVVEHGFGQENLSGQRNAHDPRRHVHGHAHNTGRRPASAAHFLHDLSLVHPRAHGQPGRDECLARQDVPLEAQCRLHCRAAGIEDGKKPVPRVVEGAAALSGCDRAAEHVVVNAQQREVGFRADLRLEVHGIDNVGEEQHAESPLVHHGGRNPARPRSRCGGRPLRHGDPHGQQGIAHLAGSLIAQPRVLLQGAGNNGVEAAVAAAQPARRRPVPCREPAGERLVEHDTE